MPRLRILPGLCFSSRSEKFESNNYGSEVVCVFLNIVCWLPFKTGPQKVPQSQALPCVKLEARF